MTSKDKQTADWHKLHDISQHLQSAFLTDWDGIIAQPSSSCSTATFPKLSSPSLWASIANCQASCASATSSGAFNWAKNQMDQQFWNTHWNYVNLIIRGWKCSSIFIYCITISTSIEIQYKSWPLLQMVGSAPGHFSLDFQSSLACRSFLNPHRQSGRTKCKNHWSEAGNLH